MTVENIASGFRVAGIFPFNPDVFGPNDYVESPVTDRPNTEATTANASPAATGVAGAADDDYDDERPFACSSCTERFARAYTLQDHMTVHSDDRDYKCTKCTRDFKQAASLWRHRRDAKHF